jgi:hypothetical protein
MRRERWEHLGHAGATIWFTGLPGSGKSTIATAAEERLVSARRAMFLLDRDNLRDGPDQRHLIGYGDGATLRTHGRSSFEWSAALVSGSSRSVRPWACRRPPTTTATGQRLLGVIRELHAANYCAYGSMWKALLRTAEQTGRTRVERLTRLDGLQGVKRRGRPLCFG